MNKTRDLVFYLLPESSAYSFFLLKMNEPVKIYLTANGTTTKIIVVAMLAF